MTAERTSGRRWSAHPWRARLLRLFVYALPIGASLAFVRLATTLTGVPTSSLAVFLLWWLGISVGASVVVSALFALTRRLLPLGGLLSLSLVFPDEAPSRFRLALSAHTVEELEDRLRLMRESGGTENVQEAAEVLLQLVAALDRHDRVTRGHAERVRGYASSLGRQLGLANDDLDRLNWAALLHDIGKLDVDAAILNKPGRPSDEEWETLRQHPLYGETLVEPIRSWLGEWADAVGYHHEQWDGAGYPRGIAGGAIPLSGRIVAIADVFDVITSVRSYKQPASAAEARAELVRCSGAQFDPRLVRAFLNISLGRMRMLVGPFSWLSHAPLLARMPITPALGATVGGLAALATAATTGASAAAPTLQATGPQPAKTVLSTAGHAAVANRLFGPHDANVAATSAAVGHANPGRTRTRKRVYPGTQPPGTAGPRPTAPRSPSPGATASPGPTATTASAPPPTATTPGPPPPAPTSPPAPSPVPPTTTAPPTAPPPSPPTPANVAPTFSAGAGQSALEDSGPHSVASWATGISAGPASESSQTVMFTVSTDNPGLFATQPTVAPTGTLTYTPAADANGVTNLTVVAVDDGGTSGGGHNSSAASTFTISVQPVNDAPDFSPGANQTAVSLLGAQTANGWATAISPGPANESAQAVSFNVTVSNPALFAVQPAVAPNGTLTYTPRALALGTVTVTVTPVDNGGTANGGSDTGQAKTFTITIL